MSKNSSETIENKQKKLKDRALNAQNKRAIYGPDIDISPPSEATDEASLSSLKDLEKRLAEASLLAGIDVDEKNRSGSFFQRGNSVIYEGIKDAYQGKIEVLTIENALEKYSWLWDYWWSLVPVDMDKYTALVELYGRGGYFIRILPGAKIEEPIQSCLLLPENDSSQLVHNIVVAEEDSQAQIITGCTGAPTVNKGYHLGISEFFIKKGASLSFTMVHNWAEDFHVRARTGVQVEDEGTFVNNYLLLQPVRSIQAYPRIMLTGRGARARSNTVVFGQKEADLDLGSLIELNGENTSGDAISRALSTDSSRVMMRGRLLARSNTSKAHLECKGMILSHSSCMNAVPELWVEGAPQADMTHEAAVGPVSQEAVEYLMSRGFTEEESVAAILQGFLQVNMEGLPDILEEMLQKTLGKLVKSSL